MKTRIVILPVVLLALVAVGFPAAASDDAAITRMALCRDSWVEWTRTEPARFAALRDHVMGAFAPHENDPYWLPKPGAKVSVAGLHVAQLFPASVGMGVGFSLMVDASYGDARKAAEKALGKTLAHCETGDGMKSCELGIGHQRTFMLMAEDSPKSRRTLIGCYYYYEK